MKSVISYIIVCLLTLNILTFQCVRWYFESQRAFISKNLCEKRNTKNNKCQGKCQLKKLLKTSESQQKVLDEIKKEYIPHASFSVFVSFEIEFIDKTFTLTQISITTSNGYLHTLFSPPDFLKS
ncbi:MAG: hypothetical protein U0V72_10185 [Cytophagales bacterium]